jgi:hypothetical protein
LKSHLNNENEKSIKPDPIDFVYHIANIKLGNCEGDENALTEALPGIPFISERCFLSN